MTDAERIKELEAEDALLRGLLEAQAQRIVALEKLVKVVRWGGKR